MIIFPNCKINLGLHILRKREDGFHDLETVFYPLLIQDALEVVNSNSTEAIEFSISGVTLNINLSENICIKAYQVLKADYPQLPAVKMHLHKTIPSGAGLGGGSANGAFTLLLLNKKYQLGITEEQLIQYALQLGSDCPFFIKNQPCYGTGRGEALEPLPLDLSAYKIVVVNPGIHVNTGWAFSQLKPYDNRPSLKQIFQQPVQEWKNLLVNDFEAPIFEYHPEIAVVKDTLYNAGAVYAAMSGSGSTVFGLFEKEVVPTLSYPESFFVKTIM